MRLSRQARALESPSEATFPQRLDRPFAVGSMWVDLSCTGAAQVYRRQQGLAACLTGTLYGHSLEEILDLYGQCGEGFAAHLEGTFALALLDLRAGRIWAITDRLGSRKIYARQQGETLFVSTALTSSELSGQPLSVAGLACALATGTMLGDLTLYKNVSSLERASVHALTPEGMACRPYWTFSFAPPSRASAADLVAELTGLLRAAVRRRLLASGPRVFLSLSGGYDSRGLLSLMTETGREIHTFAYSAGPPAPGSDADAAGRLARQYGARHVNLTSYQGDLEMTLQRNALWGQGVANFCDEADAWAELAEHCPSDIFVGEQLFGWYDRPAQSMTELLGHAHVPDAQALTGLQGVISEGPYDALRGAYDTQLRALVGRLPGRLDPTQLETLAYLEQLGPRRLLPWREQFAARVAPVHFPLLDGQLLDFLQTLPRAQIREKALFKQTLRALDPDLLKVPLARTSGYAADWSAELLRHRGALFGQLGTKPSQLDDYISPQAIGDLLVGLSPPRKTPLKTALGTVRRMPLIDAVLGARPALPRSVDRPTLLLRLLTLRRLV